MKWWPLILSAALAGCGAAGDASTDGPGDAPPDLTLAVDLAPAPDLTPRGTLPNGYPGPPYGAAVGDVVQNFSFKGYFAPDVTTGLASAQTYGDVSFNDARMSGKKFMLVMFAGFS